MSGYLGLVTSEHRNRPRFMATVAAVTDPLCGLQELLETMRAAFDVDSAVGGQLDRTGEWIGRSRHLRLELDDVYFEWGREAVGWARGSWKSILAVNSHKTRRSARTMCANTRARSAPAPAKW